jgi:ELWxxDGT repeat protein
MDGSDLFGLENLNGTLLFWANFGSNGIELWKSDGTSTGTMPVKKFPFSHSDTSHFVSANGALFFTADDGVHGVQLWKYVPDSLSERPALKVARAGNQMTLSWPASFSGFVLEASTDLRSALNWSKTPDAPTIVGSDYSVSTSMTSVNQFYRLRR